ncbi:hypothetical protein CDAR_511041 [Caerostris darwini]|uniref:Uncharacterized protein n=1 Tax=Caerostris darwini TaxID=1538125 RepID=A0AAV4S744_9ARAC|nr:hypothetical protein CDAR_511041 [Caerostris darwini]
MLRVLKTSAFARPSPVTAIESVLLLPFSPPPNRFHSSGGWWQGWASPSSSQQIPKSARKDAGERRRELQEQRRERERWGVGIDHQCLTHLHSPAEYPTDHPTPLPPHPPLLTSGGWGRCLAICIEHVARRKDFHPSSSPLPLRDGVCCEGRGVKRMVCSTSTIPSAKE